MSEEKERESERRVLRASAAILSSLVLVPAITYKKLLGRRCQTEVSSGRSQDTVTKPEGRIRRGNGTKIYENGPRREASGDRTEHIVANILYIEDDGCRGAGS